MVRLLPRRLQPSESQEQTMLVDWMSWNDLIFYHVPNGGKRDLREASKFRRLGVKAGVPDLCIPHPTSRYHGLYIELKSHSGKLTKEQDWWVKKLNDLGYRAEVAFGGDEGIQIIQDYLS